VTLSDGKSVKLDQAAYGELRALPNRADREKVMTAFFNALASFGRTFGTSMSGEVLKVQFYAKARKYPSISLAARRPEHSRVGLHPARRRREPEPAGVSPLPEAARTHDEGRQAALLRPLRAARLVGRSEVHAGRGAEAGARRRGAARTDYQATIGRAFDSRWIDLYPNEGKASGAYSDGGAYDVHPYMLINYNGQYTDVSTLAHELGHTMQSYYSNKTQPYPLAGYPTFVAEVASTFNESLLIDYMLGQIKDDDTRLSLLGNYLENIKGHGVPPDAVRRIRAAHARDGGKRSADYRPTRSRSCTWRSPRNITATRKASAWWTRTSRMSGATSPTSTATSTSSSTRPRSPPPRRSRRR